MLQYMFFIQCAYKVASSPKFWSMQRSTKGYI